MSLSGRTALVTGSNSGIGLAIAEALASAGARVAINSFTDRPEDHAMAARLAESYAVDIRYFAADMRDAASAAGLVTQAATAFGGLDILVNNAGIQHVAPIEAFPPHRWDDIIAVNLTAAFHTVRTAVPLLRAAGWGRIINVASAHGLVASPYKSAYVAAKHGLVGLTKTVALELAETGITCNAICPGYVRTPLVEAQIPDQMRAHGMDRDIVVREVMLERQPTKRFVEAADIGAFAVFLCSDAARQITGAALPIDGGWTAL